MIVINSAEWEVMLRDAETAYPRECCGILLGASSGEVSEVCSCRNIQDDLHAEDSGRFPRGARLAYCIDPSDYLKTLSHALQEGLTITGFYHSHPDRDARFSQEDKDNASVGGELLFPGMTYVVLSVIAAQVRDVKAFVYDVGLKDFGEQIVRRRWQQ